MADIYMCKWNHWYALWQNNTEDTVKLYRNNGAIYGKVP
jgi:hypothetical protein